MDIRKHKITQLQKATEHHKKRRAKWEKKKKTYGLKAARTTWRNYYKFSGKLPSYKLFYNIQSNFKIKSPNFMPRKRANILIFKYFTPWELIFVVSRVCKNFYILSWDPEVIKPMLVSYLGTEKLKEVKYKLGKEFMANENIPNSFKKKDIIVSSSSSEDYSDASGHNINLESSTTSGEEALIVKRIKNYEPRQRKRERIDFKKITFGKVLRKLHGRRKKITVEDLIDSDMTTTEEENFIDKTMRISKKKIKEKKIAKYSDIIPESPDYLRRLLTFIAKITTCASCYQVSEKEDEYGLLKQCEILNVPICYSCSQSNRFARMTIVSINQKYGITKKELEESGLKYIMAPNPGATQLEMHLYYEFQVKQKLPEIMQRREAIKEMKIIERKAQKEVKQMGKYNGKKAEIILRIQSMCKKEGNQYTRKQIENIYINNELTEAYLAGRYMTGKPASVLKDVIDNPEKFKKELSKVKKRNAKAFVKKEEPEDVDATHKKRKRKKAAKNSKKPKKTKRSKYY